MERRGDIGNLKVGVGAGFLGLVKNERVLFPLQAIADSQFLNQLQHIGIGTKKGMKPRFVHIAVFIFPGCNESAENVSTFIDNGLVSSIHKVFSTG